MGGLSGCVAPYTPYQGSDAAELTIISTSPSTTTVFTIDKATCPQPKSLVLAHLEANTTWWGHKDTKEFKTEPIRIPANELFKASIMSGGGVGRCQINLAFLPKSNTRYTLSVDADHRVCTASLRRIQDGKAIADVEGFRIPKGSFSDMCFK